MALMVFLADKSAWALRRFQHVDDKFLEFVTQGQLACCEMVALELGYSARDPEDYEVIHREVRTLRWLDVTGDVMKRALSVQRILAAKSHHRLSIPDLVIAATAEFHRATMLHNDKDFEIIAEVTHQPVLRVADLFE